MNFLLVYQSVDKEAEICGNSGKKSVKVIKSKQGFGNNSRFESYTCFVNELSNTRRAHVGNWRLLPSHSLNHGTFSSSAVLPDMHKGYECTIHSLMYDTFTNAQRHARVQIPLSAYDPFGQPANNSAL